MKNIICTLFGHSSKKQINGSDNKCPKYKYCERCGSKIEMIPDHFWGMITYSGNKNIVSRTCNKCNCKRDFFIHKIPPVSFELPTYWETISDSNLSWTSHSYLIRSPKLLIRLKSQFGTISIIEDISWEKDGSLQESR